MPNTIKSKIMELLESGDLDWYQEEVHHMESPVFNRIIEVLYDYWLTEPDEDRVKVTLEFWKGDEYQAKTLEWHRTDQADLAVEPLIAADRPGV